MAEHVYSQQLLHLGYGLPLYEPNPAGRYDEIRIGDVGYMEEGAFLRLFNITFPGSHEINRLGVPEGFEPLMLTEDDTHKRDPLPAGAMCSATVTSQRAGVGATSGPGLPLQAGAFIHISCSSKTGAALITSHPSYRLDTYKKRVFSRYMLKQYRSWVYYACERLGRDVRVKDITLVTGRDLTKRWATIAFIETTKDNEISFHVGDRFGSVLGQGELSARGSWSTNIHVPHRCGPEGVEPPEESDSSEGVFAGPSSQPTSPTSRSGRYNQCVFLRGFRIRERTRLFPKVIKAPPAGEDSESSNDDSSSPSSSPVMSTGSYSSANSSTDSMEIEIIHGVPGRNPRADKDAYDVMARFLFENTEAEVALLHGDEVCIPFKCNMIETLEELSLTLRVEMQDCAELNVEEVDGAKVGCFIPRSGAQADKSHPASVVVSMDDKVSNKTGGPVVPSIDDEHSHKVASESRDVGLDTRPGHSCEIARLDGPNLGCWMSPTGRFFAICRDLKTSFFISFLETGSMNQRGPGFRSKLSIVAIAWSTAESHIVTRSDNGIIQKWSNILNSPTLIATSTRGHVEAKLEYSPDDRLIATCDGWTEKLWNALDLSLLWEPSQFVQTAVFHPFRNKVFFCSATSIDIVNTENLAKIEVKRRLLKGDVSHPVFSPRGDFCVARTSQDMKILDADTFEEKGSLFPCCDCEALRVT